MRKSDYQDLLVWQKGILLCPEIYTLTKLFPDSERFGLTSQMQRAVASIPTNIAEGHGRSSNKDFVRFLYISIGSFQELETLLRIAKELGYIETVDPWHKKTRELAKMLTGLIRTLNTDG
jgi:four helix bundle protein